MEMYEKLELIAKCMREGWEVERKPHHGAGWEPSTTTIEADVHVYRAFEYRAKPEKPRVGRIQYYPKPAMTVQDYQAVELTPEVRSALEDAGIEI